MKLGPHTLATALILTVIGTVVFFSLSLPVGARQHYANTCTAHAQACPAAACFAGGCPNGYYSYGTCYSFAQNIGSCCAPNPTHILTPAHWLIRAPRTSYGPKWTSKHNLYNLR